jgi:hypothetical protein
MAAKLTVSSAFFAFLNAVDGEGKRDESFILRAAAPLLQAEVEVPSYFTCFVHFRLIPHTTQVSEECDLIGLDLSGIPAASCRRADGNFSAGTILVTFQSAFSVPLYHSSL